MSIGNIGGMMASNQRPIPLRKRPDLVVARIEYLGVGYQVVKDPLALKYHRLQIEQYRILELLNGARSLEVVRDELKREFPTLQITLNDIQQLITDLHRKGLVVSDRAGQGASVVRERRKARREKIKQTLMSLLSLRLPGWDPEQTLRAMVPWCRWMFHPLCAFFCLLFVASAWLVLGANLEEFRSRLPEFQSFFGWPNLIYLWITLGVAKVIHEFGHGLSCVHYGGECHEMGVMLLVFSPCLYCDVTDSWMMKNKWHRIIIGAAGMYIEVILSAIAIYVWWLTKPGLLHHLSLNIFFVTTITTVIFNANPLMRFDGYYMMSDFLEIPNLRQKSEKLLREAFAWYCLGIESRPDPFMPETGRGWFVTYAIAAWCYRWVVLVSISLFLYTVLKPYDLQSIGVTVLIFSMAGIFFALGRSVWQIISAPRMEPMSKPKIAVSLTISCVVLWLLASIPIPWYHEAACVLEPEGVVQVPAPLAGRILQPEEYAVWYSEMERLQTAARERMFPILVPGRTDVLLVNPADLNLLEGMPAASEYTGVPENGVPVEQGAVIAILENPDVLRRQDDLRRRVAELVWRSSEFDSYMRQNDIGPASDTLAEALELQKVIRELVKLGAQRVVRAPTSGNLVAARRVPPQPRNEVERMKLAPWHGTPLDDRNAGCSVEAGQELVSIAPSDRLHAVLYVDQTDREEVKRQPNVQIKLDHLPDTTWETQITSLSAKGEIIAPESLTTQYGGSLATKPGQGGQQQLASTVFRATAGLNFVGHDESREDAALMKPGMRGHARFIVSDRTVYDWAKLYFYETFRFRL
jgi:putative peptide zinc metalloprotease protein